MMRSSSFLHACTFTIVAIRSISPATKIAARFRLNLPFLPFLNRLRPIILEQAGEAAVGEELAAGLAAGAVVGFVFGPDDPLHRGAADGAGLAEASVDCHFRAKGGYLLWEFPFRLGEQTLGPALERCLNRRIEPLDL